MNDEKTLRFDDWLESEMQDAEFRSTYEALEPAYQVARLRIMRGLTRQQLADLVGARGIR